MANFVRVTWGDGGDKVGIDNPTFHEVDRRTMMVVQQAIVSHEHCWVQTDLTEEMFPVNSLVPYIMKRIADSWMSHPQVRVNLEKKWRNESRLPIVAVNDVRMLIRFEKELQSCPAEKSKALT